MAWLLVYLNCGRRRRRREVPEGIPRSINVDLNILCNDRIKHKRPSIGELFIALNKYYLTTRFERQNYVLNV